MLVGSQVKFVDTASSLDNQADRQGVFTVVANDTSGLKISPAMKSTALSGADASTLELHILPYKTPPINTGMTHAANNESILTDQFLSIDQKLYLRLRLILKKIPCCRIG